GHVDDYRDKGGEYHMRPQCFRNTGGGRFVEVAPGQAGDYFEHKYLGRGLARLDWNRDGRMDFVVSNIGAPASLVTNQTDDAGHFLNVRLHATLTARDTIGAIVEVVAGKRRWTKQLVAGDGYMASNERVLQFGLADSLSVAEVRINWPSGQSTMLQNVPVDVTIELVEGARRATLRRGMESETLEVAPVGFAVQP
ncbi:MAG TPA: ASPIC/UnbV domain-containing protein, partial [Planctomycetaceae bacterium]